MRAYQKDRILERIREFPGNHDDVVRLVKQGNTDMALQLLTYCQEKAIDTGNYIESSAGEGSVSVSFLEEYCETIYKIYENLSAGGEISPNNISKKLSKAILKVENSIVNEFKVKPEVVFLPYKASMWDSLESVWKRAAADSENVETFVIPIPYYDRKPDGSLGEIHYEGDLFPSYVPITNYKEYNFETCQPAQIYIHNPYDDSNLVTMVAPFFFSANLKKYTDELIYIPYFVLEEPNVNNPESLDGISHFVLTKGVINSSKIVVQSENMREAYIRILTKQFGDNTRKIWEERISGAGSPKIEKIQGAKVEDYIIPEEWAKLINNPDGTKKKVVLYNTSLGALLENSEKMIEKIEDSLMVFKNNSDKVVLWWRPHPLIEATLTSMRPALWESYKAIRDRYINEGWGIYDDSPDMDRALVLSDAYYGDESSLVTLYKHTGKPIMIQNPYVLANDRNNQGRCTSKEKHENG